MDERISHLAAGRNVDERNMRTNGQNTRRILSTLNDKNANENISSKNFFEYTVTIFTPLGHPPPTHPHSHTKNQISAT